MRNEFKNAKVLITGHTGFKGSWLTAWLKHLGAHVVGVSLDPPTTPSHYDAAKMSGGIQDIRLDIRDQKALTEIVASAKPDFVFHLAAQALVRKSYENPIETWQTNLLGTLNVLESLRALNNPCSAVIITSDKCYENVEWIWGYRENDSMGGIDPYSASKGAAEIAIRSHILSFFSSSSVRVASARAGNVIGGGDWASDRIIPDCVRAWSTGEYVELRNPHSTRPWQHVLEPLSGYLSLAIALSSNPALHGEAFNFGPLAQQNRSVIDLVKEMATHWDQVRWRDISDNIDGPHESSLLKLNCDKAMHYLNWHAALDFKDTVRMTAAWYRKFYENQGETIEVTNEQIIYYMDQAKGKELEWAR
jgi:CDP-glucose 4,6-dehydratase